MVAVALAARSGASSSAFLASFRSLSIAAALQPSTATSGAKMARSKLPMQQARQCASKASQMSASRLFYPSPYSDAIRTLQARSIWRPTVSAVLPQQQTRGMKVHSSVKKRCEHCKVRKRLLRAQGFEQRQTRLRFISSCHTWSMAEYG